jgi:Zn-dependent protease
MWHFLQMPTSKGSIRLFKLFGITVYLHWAWFIALYVLVKLSGHPYSSIIWNVLQCLALFFIVLMHEFGHQLACRSVGGQTHDIILWPMGGVAYVSPPQRPGAQLWSIAAGPLVNVFLIPILYILVMISPDFGNQDVYNLIHMIQNINITLLVFNMLPIYPLDGGQILRSLLWFVFGRANSLLIASIIGFIGVGALFIVVILAFFVAPLWATWMGAIAGFIVLTCWSGLRQAQALSKIDKAPRREGFACPVCKAVPPMGEFWHCGKCHKPFDVFGTLGFCPHCATQYSNTTCPECGNLRPITEWNFSHQPPAQQAPPTLPPQS